MKSWLWAVLPIFSWCQSLFIVILNKVLLIKAIKQLPIAVQIKLFSASHLSTRLDEFCIELCHCQAETRDASVYVPTFTSTEERNHLHIFQLWKPNPVRTAEVQMKTVHDFFVHCCFAAMAPFSSFGLIYGGFSQQKDLGTVRKA